MTLSIYHAWARNHGVSESALQELFGLLGVATMHATASRTDGESESRVQSRIRLAYAKQGTTLFRNNVGVLKREDGTPVRFGLANDSAALNKVLKSGDLIGWTERVITHDMVGSVIAQFTSIECKHAGWQYTGEKREVAQLKWNEIVNKSGGYARFSNGSELQCVPS